MYCLIASMNWSKFMMNLHIVSHRLMQIFEEAMRALLAAVGDLGRDHPAEIWVTFFEHIAAYERLYRALLGKNGSPWFVRKMRAALVGLINERGQLPHGPTAADQPVHTF